MMTEAESQVYFCAFRYCLGRQTYVVYDFCCEAKSKITRITDRYILLMARDLAEAIQADDKARLDGIMFKPLGDDYDRAEWIKFSKIVSSEAGRRKLKSIS